MSNKELIAGLRGEHLDCNCAAYSRSECCCSTNWPESFCEEAADALELADKRIAELQAQLYEADGIIADKQHKLAIAREALASVVAMPRSAESIRRCTQALAQIETNQG